MEKKTLAELAHARNLAQKHLEDRIKEEYAIGTQVTFQGVRGPTKGEVTSVEGEMVTIGKIRRSWEKVTIV